MEDPQWEPLPPDVAEWMGLDEAMVPFLRDLSGLDPAPEPSRAEVPITSW